MGFLDDRFTIPPEQRDGGQNTQVTPPVTEGSVQPPVTEGPPAETPPVADTFFETFNTRFGTQYKADDEVRALFDSHKRVGEYETRLKEAEGKASKADEYQKQIEEIRNNGNSEFLSKPLVRKAYVAEQLLAKYPDKDPNTLQEIVMADVDKMDDLTVLIKEQKIDFPNYSDEDHRTALLKSLGVDPDSDPKEWDSITKLSIAKQASSARKTIKALTEGIELPRVVTKEEREKAESEALQKRMTEISPLKEEFTKFESFADERIGDFKWEVPKEYQSKLDGMFQAMFIDSGMEPTPENKESLITLRNALLVLEELPKMLETARKQGDAERQRKTDEALHNTQPPNTTTAPQASGGKELPGLSKFLQDN